MKQYDVVIVGAGAAGLMCAIEAGKRGRKVWLIDHSKKIGEKIRISGGGRCNFTNIHAAPNAYLSQNPHFCKSALSQYTQQDFIEMVEKHRIKYHEKKLGQLFCDVTAQDIIDMLLKECEEARVHISKDTAVEDITKDSEKYVLTTTQGMVKAESLVIATGGLSIPKIGATKWGYTIAKQFGHDLVETRAGLVPLTFTDEILAFARPLQALVLMPWLLAVRQVLQKACFSPIAVLAGHQSYKYRPIGKRGTASPLTLRRIVMQKPI